MYEERLVEGEVINPIRATVVERADDATLDNLQRELISVNARLNTQLQRYNNVLHLTMNEPLVESLREKIQSFMISEIM